MSFLNPGLLWGLLAVTVPIAIFLIFRRKYKTIEWAAMEFLLRAQQRTNRRLKIENLLLLILRCLLLALLALALARPRLVNIANAIPLGSSTHHILVLDASYSMGYQIEHLGQETFFGRAQQQALHILDGMQEEDEISVLRMDGTPEAVVENHFGKEDFIVSKLHDLALSHERADFAGALAKVKDLIGHSSKQNQVVYILTDFQASTFFPPELPTADGKTPNGSNAIELLTRELSDLPNVATLIYDVGDASVTNHQFRRLSSAELKTITGIETEFSVELFNHGGQPEQNCEVIFRVDGDEKHRELIDLLPAHEAVEKKFLYTFTAPGQHYVTAELAESSQDNLPLDDVRYFAVEALPNIRVLCVNGEVGGQFTGETDYLREVFPRPEDAGAAASMIAADVALDADLTEKSFENYDVVLFCNVGALDEHVAQALDHFVREEGKSAVWFLGDQVDVNWYNTKLYANGKGLLPASLKGVTGDPQHINYQWLAPKNFDHPMLRYYRDIPGFIKDTFVYQYYTIEMDPAAKDTRSVIHYDNGSDVALAEKFAGKGKTMLWTTTADIEWNNIPTRKIYLALMYDMISYLAYRERSDLNLPVRGRIVWEYPLDYADKAVMLTPQHGDVQLEATTACGDARRVFFDATQAAGIYQFVAKYQGALDKPDPAPHDMNVYFAVNVDPDEGDLQRASEQQLNTRYPGFKFRYHSHQPGGGMTVAEEDDSQTRELWKLFAYAALGLLFIESFLAQRFGRYKTMPGPG